MSNICIQWKVRVTESVLQSPAEKIDSSKAQCILILFQFYRTTDVDVAGKYRTWLAAVTSAMSRTVNVPRH